MATNIKLPEGYGVPEGYGAANVYSKKVSPEVQKKVVRRRKAAKNLRRKRKRGKKVRKVVKGQGAVEQENV